jgi:hypothetical protein
MSSESKPYPVARRRSREESSKVSPALRQPANGAPSARLIRWLHPRMPLHKLLTAPLMVWRSFALSILLPCLAWQNRMWLNIPKRLKKKYKLGPEKGSRNAEIYRMPNLIIKQKVQTVKAGHSLLRSPLIPSLRDVQYHVPRVALRSISTESVHPSPHPEKHEKKLFGSQRN